MNMNSFFDDIPSIGRNCDESMHVLFKAMSNKKTEVAHVSISFTFLLVSLDFVPNKGVSDILLVCSSLVSGVFDISLFKVNAEMYNHMKHLSLVIINQMRRGHP